MGAECGIPNPHELAANPYPTKIRRISGISTVAPLSTTR